MTNYCVFLGIWLFVIALLGLLSSFISALAGIVTVVLDGLSMLFAFAGGVVRCPSFLTYTLHTSSPLSQGQKKSGPIYADAWKQTGHGSSPRRALLCLPQHQRCLSLPHQQRHHQRRQTQRRGRSACQSQLQVSGGAGVDGVHVVCVCDVRRDVRVELFELEEGGWEIRR